MMLAFKPNILAIIPARGGSKGLPRKNIKMLNNKPMIAYSIEAAIQANCFQKIIVSTDDHEIAGIAKQHGADVPFIRPANLAIDSTSQIEVMLHGIEHFEQQQCFFDAVMMLQPTSPLRQAEDIINSINMFVTKQATSVISVCEADHSPLWMNVLPEDHNLDNFLNKTILNKRRQELPIYYRLNGAIYMVDIKFVKTTKSIYSEKSYAYVMPRARSIDVDELIDFLFCETMLQQNLSTTLIKN